MLQTYSGLLRIKGSEYMKDLGVSYSKYNGFLCIEGIGRETIDLDKTFDCGQCFRWEKLCDGTWVGVIDSSIFMLKHKNFNGLDCIITTASREEWENKLINYLDINNDYIINVPENDKFAIESVEKGKGIKILDQDPWETLISFIISQRNSIPKIKKTIDRLCERFGKKIVLNVNGIDYERYTFPSKEVLSTLDIGDLAGIGLGYRDIYIIEAARSKIDLSDLKKRSSDSYKVVEELEKMYGVGPKVANCVALFGMHKLNVFPIDVWMQRIIDRYYNGSLDWQKYGSLAGVIQQYMFYNIRFSKD